MSPEPPSGPGPSPAPGGGGGRSTRRSPAEPEGAPPPDEVLARQAGLGDRNAFAQLVTRHGPVLYRYVARLLHDTHDAQDCVQETMVSAWKGIGGFRGDASVRTWLLVLARNEAQRSLRARQRRFPESGSRPVVDLERAAEQVADLHADPERDSIAAELLVALDAALLLLPERARSVWILREVEELSYAEIGAVVGATPAAVRGLLSRARSAIAATMEEWR